MADIFEIDIEYVNNYATLGEIIEEYIEEISKKKYYKLNIVNKTPYNNNEYHVFKGLDGYQEIPSNIKELFFLNVAFQTGLPVRENPNITKIEFLSCLFYKNFFESVFSGIHVDSLSLNFCRPVDKVLNMSGCSIYYLDILNLPITGYIDISLPKNLKILTIKNINLETLVGMLKKIPSTLKSLKIEDVTFNNFDVFSQTGLRNSNIEELIFELNQLVSLRGCEKLPKKLRRLDISLNGIENLQFSENLPRVLESLSIRTGLRSLKYSKTLKVPKLVLKGFFPSDLICLKEAKSIKFFVIEGNNTKIFDIFPPNVSQLGFHRGYDTNITNAPFINFTNAPHSLEYVNISTDCNVIIDNINSIRKIENEISIINVGTIKTEINFYADTEFYSLLLDLFMNDPFYEGYVFDPQRVRDEIVDIINFLKNKIIKPDDFQIIFLKLNEYESYISDNGYDREQLKKSLRYFINQGKLDTQKEKDLYNILINNPKISDTEPEEDVLYQSLDLDSSAVMMLNDIIEELHKKIKFKTHEKRKSGYFQREVDSVEKYSELYNYITSMDRITTEPFDEDTFMEVFEEYKKDFL